MIIYIFTVFLRNFSRARTNTAGWHCSLYCAQHSYTSQSYVSLHGWSHEAPIGTCMLQIPSGRWSRSAPCSFAIELWAGGNAWPVVLPWHVASAKGFSFPLGRDNDGSSATISEGDFMQACSHMRDLLSLVINSHLAVAGAEPSLVGSSRSCTRWCAPEPTAATVRKKTVTRDDWMCQHAGILGVTMLARSPDGIQTNLVLSVQQHKWTQW
jgi:hypothetical protein